MGYLGEHLEDLIDDIHVIAPSLPFNVKVSLLSTTIMHESWIVVLDVSS